jgi:hypothetical protein
MFAPQFQAAPNRGGSQGAPEVGPERRYRLDRNTRERSAAVPLAFGRMIVFANQSSFSWDYPSCAAESIAGDRP